MKTVTLPKGERHRQLERLFDFLSSLSPAYAWQVEVKRVQRNRSNQQNAYLWGVVYEVIKQHLPGWDAEDIHEYFLGEHFGWETLEGFGRKRLKPLRRSSKLSTTEFQDYIGFIQRKCSELGIYIADPSEEFSDAA